MCVCPNRLSSGERIAAVEEDTVALEDLKAARWTEVKTAPQAVAKVVPAAEARRLFTDAIAHHDQRLGELAEVREAVRTGTAVLGLWYPGENKLRMCEEAEADAALAARAARDAVG